MSESTSVRELLFLSLCIPRVYLISPTGKKVLLEKRVDERSKGGSALVFDIGFYNEEMNWRSVGFIVIKRRKSLKAMFNDVDYIKDKHIIDFIDSSAMEELNPAFALVKEYETNKFTIEVIVDTVFKNSIQVEEPAVSIDSFIMSTKNKR